MDSDVVHSNVAAAGLIEPYLGDQPAEPFVGFVLKRGERAIGSVIVNGVAHGNCYITAALWGPVTMGQCRYVFRYIFATLGCKRVTACTAIDNSRMQRMLRVLGFHLEGRHIGFYDGKDALSYGLLRDEQRII